MQRVLPEWSGEELIYVEPTQVARSFDCNVFSSAHDDKTLEWSQQTVACIPEVDGPIAVERHEYADPTAAAEEVKRTAMELGAAMVGITRVDPFHVYKGMDLPHSYVIAVPMDIRGNQVRRHSRPRPGGNQDLCDRRQARGRTRQAPPSPRLPGARSHAALRAAERAAARGRRRTERARQARVIDQPRARMLIPARDGDDRSSTGDRRAPRLGPRGGLRELQHVRLPLPWRRDLTRQAERPRGRPVEDQHRGLRSPLGQLLRLRNLP